VQHYTLGQLSKAFSSKQKFAQGTWIILMKERKIKKSLQSNGSTANLMEFEIFGKKDGL